MVLADNPGSDQVLIKIMPGEQLVIQLLATRFIPKMKIDVEGQFDSESLKNKPETEKIMNFESGKIGVINLSIKEEGFGVF